MTICGIILLSLGAFLLVVFSPWLYLDPRGATGLLDFTELFWYAQWAGFWLTIASLVLFGLSAWQMPFPVASRGTVVPGIGIVLVVLFLIFSMPEASNQRQWRKGVLGLPTYVKTKIRLHEDAAGIDGVPARFSGTWRSGRDPVVTITEDSVTIVNGAARTVQSKQTCPHRFGLEYRLTSPSGLFTYFQESHATEADFRVLEDHDYPVMFSNCGMDYTVFVLLERRKMMVLSTYAAPQILTR